MSNYNPQRGANWNYGGSNWRLSRSKIELYMKCPLCFYLDNKLGTKAPPSFPFNLNLAVDELLKKDFDLYRVAGTPHPIMVHYGLSTLVPFQHSDMDTWRSNFKGMMVNHGPTGFVIQGAVDDIWQNPAGELVIVDYKATSKNETITTLEQAWHMGYKRQMEIYQWLFRESGYNVSDTGYFLYANADKKVDGFNGQLVFESTLIPYCGKTDWIPSVLQEIKVCLESADLPPVGSSCDVCRYSTTRAKHLMV
jgi:hypothetical protein